MAYRFVDSEAFCATSGKEVLVGREPYGRMWAAFVDEGLNRDGVERMMQFLITLCLAEQLALAFA